jgi:adenylate cyclase
VRFNSVRVKVISLIFFALLLIVAASLVFSVNSQRSNLLSATGRTLLTNTEMLNRVIRNIMVKGEAPIAVDTMTSLAQIQEFSEIRIYRTDGSNAFSDYATIDFVNGYQRNILFPKTPRVEKSMTQDPSFRLVLETNAPVEHRDFGEGKSVEYFFPILNNDDRCKACHGNPKDGVVPFIRGIAHFKISVDETFRQIDRATLFLSVFFVAIGIVFAVALVFFMRGLIITPLNKIGAAVRDIGEGRLDARVEIKSKDELGDLAAKINDMIKGLNERFHLSKYVSRSTEDHVIRGERSMDGGERRRITVLFSDIRGFTSFAENAEPEIVIRALNEVLESQAEIVEKHGGDIDKYIGDELMARFDDEFEAVKCAVELVRSVKARNEARKDGLLIGVGINSGVVVAGNIGSRNRMEYAVIGDAINLASRLCGIAKPNMVLISASVQESVRERVETVLIHDLKIKGKAEPVDAYAVKALKRG